MNSRSHPSWVCGLKHKLECFICAKITVTPFVGVWIETIQYGRSIDEAVSHTLRGCVD